MKILIYIFLICFLPSTLFSQYSEWKRYMPLEIGNSWYYRSDHFILPSIYYKIFVEKDTLINDTKYFKRMRYQNGSYYGAEFIRIDSTNGNYLLYVPGNGCGSYPNDKILDSLASNVNDEIYCEYWSIYTRKCVEIGMKTVFGLQKEFKKFYHDGLTMGYMEYTKDFGITYSCSGEPPPCSGFTYLIGCRIDGNVYGDTNLVSIDIINNIVPSNFSLSQNYPNPFNPVTNIKLSLPTTQYTILQVFDISGREVATLVNEKLQAGSYEFTFDANQLSSGIYFYQLKTDEFVQSRKMVLTK